jgi:hypothetical protein
MGSFKQSRNIVKCEITRAAIVCYAKQERTESEMIENVYISFVT